ncbi:MAG: glycosyltransferase [Mycetocola sp.]
MTPPLEQPATPAAPHRHPESGAIVVVNYASSALLGTMLAPLTAQFPGIVVVVDNASSDSERTTVQHLGSVHGWSVVALPTNRGFGPGINEGVARARELGASEFFILNPDAQLSADDCLTLLRRVREEQNLILSPVITRADGRVWFDGSVLDLSDGRVGPQRRLPENEHRVPWLSGACLAVSDQLWQRLGGFDEDYFLYWEDVDLSWRAREMGARLEVASDISAIHLVGATQQSSGKSALYYRCNAHNRSLFAFKNLSTAQRADWSRHTAAVVAEIMLRGGRRQFLRHPGLLVTWWKALRAARAVDRASTTDQIPARP